MVERARYGKDPNLAGIRPNLIVRWGREACSLPQIAVSAEQLDVRSHARTAPRAGHDVIEMEITPRPAVPTTPTVPLPHEDTGIVRDRISIPGRDYDRGPRSSCDGGIPT